MRPQLLINRLTASGIATQASIPEIHIRKEFPETWIFLNFEKYDRIVYFCIIYIASQITALILHFKHSILNQYIWGFLL